MAERFENGLKQNMGKVICGVIGAVGATLIFGLWFPLLVGGVFGILFGELFDQPTNSTQTGSRE